MTRRSAAWLATGLALVLGIAGLGLMGLAAGSFAGHQDGLSFPLYQMLDWTRRDAALIGGRLVLASLALNILRIVFWGGGPIRYLDMALAVVTRKTLTLLGQDGQWYRPWRVAIMLSPVAIWAILFRIEAMPHLALLNLDSNSYIQFHIQRTIGYPIFIRLAAVMVNDPWLITLGQLFMGCGATVFLAEALARATRTVLAPMVVGLGLLLNWWLEWFSAHFLSDYTFYALMTLHLGAVFMALERPGRLRLALAAAAAIAAIAVRPAGSFLFLLIPLVMLLSRTHWRRVLAWFAVPTLLLALLLAAVHWQVYDYVSLSRFRGHTSLANAMLLIEQPDTLPHAELARSLQAAAAPYRQQYLSLPDRQSRYIFLQQNTNALLGQGFLRVQDYLDRHPELVWTSDISKHEALYNAIGDWSALNAAMNHMSVATGPRYLATEDVLATLTSRAYLANPRLLWSMQWDKMLGQWSELLVVAPVQTSCRSLAFHPEAPDFGFAQLDANSDCVWSRLFNPVPFNIVAIGLYGANRLIWGPWLAFIAGATAVFLSLRSIIGRKPRTRRADILTYAFLVLSSYTVTVALAHVPIARYTLTLMPAFLVLLTSPLLALASWRESPGWERLIGRLSSARINGEIR